MRQDLSLTPRPPPFLSDKGRKEFCDLVGGEFCFLCLSLGLCVCPEIGSRKREKERKEERKKDGLSPLPALHSPLGTPSLFFLALFLDFVSLSLPCVCLFCLSAHPFNPSFFFCFHPSFLPSFLSRRSAVLVQCRGAWFLFLSFSLFSFVLRACSSFLLRTLD